MCCPFSVDELEHVHALRELKIRKSPGTDNITNEMLIHSQGKTRESLLRLLNNTLDLVLTNRSQDVATITTLPTKLSDHKLIECTLTYNPIDDDYQYTPNWSKQSFRAINYHKADFESMNNVLGAVDWVALKMLCEEIGDNDGENFKELLMLTVLQIALKHSPHKESHFPKIKGCKLTTYEMKDVLMKGLEEKEMLAIQTIKSNHK